MRYFLLILTLLAGSAFAQELHVRDGGSWHEVDEVHVRVSGSWEEVQEGWVRVSGSWEQFYTAAYEYLMTAGQSASNVGFDDPGYGSLDSSAFIGSSTIDAFRINGSTFLVRINDPSSEVVEGSITTIVVESDDAPGTETYTVGAGGGYTYFGGTTDYYTWDREHNWTLSSDYTITINR